MNIDSSMTHTPKAIPTNAIRTIGTDTARVPSPFSNLRAIKSSKFKSRRFYSLHKSIIFHSIRQNRRILFHKSLIFPSPEKSIGSYRFPSFLPFCLYLYKIPGIYGKTGTPTPTCRFLLFPHPEKTESGFFATRPKIPSPPLYIFVKSKTTLPLSETERPAP